MIEPELQHYLSGINQHLDEIKKNQKHGIWRAFFNGMFSAVGYVVGLALVITLLVFILNKMGILPAWKEGLKSFQSVIDNANKLMKTGDSGQGNASADGTIITLPDGRKVKVIQQP